MTRGRAIEAIVSSASEGVFAVMPRTGSQRMGLVHVHDGVAACKNCEPSQQCVHAELIKQLAAARRLPPPGHIRRIGNTLEPT